MWKDKVIEGENMAGRTISWARKYFLGEAQSKGNENIFATAQEREEKLLPFFCQTFLNSFGIARLLGRLGRECIEVA